MKAICGRQLLDTTLILFSAGYGKPALTKMDEFLVFNEIGINTIILKLCNISALLASLGR